MIPTIKIPGSKSISNRALLIAALANGTTILRHFLWSDDTVAMMDALKALGVIINVEEDDLHIISSGRLVRPKQPLYLENSGTSMRFLTAILANQKFRSYLDGNARMRERPIKDLLDALKALGVRIESQNGCPPLKIYGHQIKHNRVEIKGQNSSQYISALMMLAPLLAQGLEIQVKGKVNSRPYLEITAQIMNKFFIQNITTPNSHTFKIPHQSYEPTTLEIEADASSASYFWGLAAITGKTIKTRGISRNSLQPDVRLLDYLEKMGCKVKADQTGIMVTGPTELIPLGIVGANDFPDGAMTLALVASFAEGETELRGLHTLKIKESNRLQAISTELRKLNIAATEKQNSLVINGNPKLLRGAKMATYNDHRLAMCFGMAGCRIKGLKIENPRCVEKTYPNFWKDLRKAHPITPFPSFY
ncbi:MAG: 3-phosphoshikimate 1-carboxyvinyltransferase, 3-phosphoshikimate 1-carboxyvinyltransferase [Candidatus Peregrinibacteria bacterium GW2011_GWE2_39_6]|nr:MAG: 3-phosphoshikimate 1-carboxyvinyltransferase, 3-phosphoshikimate 1-carboxyvinyltransferase [Candidatus Peregrinibacteria bacterium GW2011_GWF2_39_17]KKR25497.1 MAG: 3-phosphoshikimate 1-carboxyvinyltransferase, 3-phosphoshikimate 1-carboxyvinyltransferase [Candidatus Peregrinibacteria bacterium GW2011_GWE2_39_6]HCW31906.1 3-phosphoshikimate 1-carboxyvinyltransferase [Candidatus Peregrinibacteria bacterium]